MRHRNKYIRLFDSLPSGRAFSDRLINLRIQADFNGVYLVPHAKAVTDDTYRLVEAYRDKVFDYLRDVEDTEADLIAANPIVEISMTAYRAGKKAGNFGFLQATWTIDDNYIDYMYEHPRWIRGLREAVYMMITIPEVTRYLLEPIVKFPLDDKLAADLWIHGHRVDFCKDRTLLIVGGT